MQKWERLPLAILSPLVGVVMQPSVSPRAHKPRLYPLITASAAANIAAQAGLRGRRSVNKHQAAIGSKHYNSFL